MDRVPGSMLICLCLTVPFLEAGRVGPAWNMHELNSSIRRDTGIGFRAMAEGLVVRIDLAASNEGASAAMMVSQPYQF